jgi:hypothetical protein
MRLTPVFLAVAAVVSVAFTNPLGSRTYGAEL